jgi:hypothetical protein
MLTLVPVTGKEKDVSGDKAAICDQEDCVTSSHENSADIFIFWKSFCKSFLK